MQMNTYFPTNLPIYALACLHIYKHLRRRDKISSLERSLK